MPAVNLYAYIRGYQLMNLTNIDDYNVPTTNVPLLKISGTEINTNRAIVNQIVAPSDVYGFFEQNVPPPPSGNLAIDISAFLAT